jgi:hypothetical protein
MAPGDHTEAPLGRSRFERHDAILRPDAPLDPWFDKTS